MGFEGRRRSTVDRQLQTMLTIAHQIAYLAIVGLLMLAALIEWFLWLAAFLYCLGKVFRKAGNASTRILAVVMMVVFAVLR